MRNAEYKILFLTPVSIDLEVGDTVSDITAVANGWPDQIGEIVRLDGSNALVRYQSGEERTKATPNLMVIARPLGSHYETYGDIVSGIENCPVSMLPAILIVTVENLILRAKSTASWIRFLLNQVLEKLTS